MCINSADTTIPTTTFISASRLIRPSKHHSLRVRRLNRSVWNLESLLYTTYIKSDYLHRFWNVYFFHRRRSKGVKRNHIKVISLKTKLEVKNLKLYRKNQSIIQENEKLREKAFLLYQENQELLLQLQKKKLSCSLN